MANLERKKDQGQNDPTLAIKKGSLPQHPADRQQALRDYKLTIEYKHLRDHAPAGVFVIPSFGDLRRWYGAIFVRRGHFSNGIFKFRVDLPNEYNDVNTWPVITFYSKIFNPLVHPESGLMDLKCAYPEWNPNRHYMVTVLTFLKKIFYMKEFQFPDPPNPEAQHLFNNNKKEFWERVAACVRESLEKMYDNEPGSSLRFTEEKPAHEHMRRSILEPDTQKADANSSGNMLASIEQARLSEDLPPHENESAKESP